jgi:hypothetical protein
MKEQQRVDTEHVSRQAALILWGQPDAESGNMTGGQTMLTCSLIAGALWLHPADVERVWFMVRVSEIIEVGSVRPVEQDNPKTYFDYPGRSESGRFAGFWPQDVYEGLRGCPEDEQ